MIVTTIIGNLHSSKGAAMIAGKHVEKISMPATDLVKRIQRLTTDHGEVIGLRLPTDAPDLRDGDILHVTDDNAIVISQLPTEVIVITPKTITEMGIIAHNLGNRHLPAQFFNASSEYKAEVMVVQYDPTVVTFLKNHQVAFSCENRILSIPFRHAEHTH